MEIDKTQILDKTGRPVLFEVIKSDAYTIPPGETPFNAAVRMYIGTSGDLVVKLANDTEFTTFKNVPEGMIFPGNIIAIKDTTTASDLVIVG